MIIAHAKFPLIAILAAIGLALAADPVTACSPDALGVSRVLPVGTLGGGAIGLKTYPRTLKLAPGEVALTFDDGPMPHRTDKVLDVLAAECVKATFFMIGRNAQAAPALAQRVAREGHTIGYHTMNHPILSRMATSAAEKEIDDGFAAVDRAVYDSTSNEPHTPFFRFPGFADSPALDAWLARRDIVIFGTDMWASDWEKETPEQEEKLTLSRLDHAKGGVVLFHDIQSRTIAMLPGFLRMLKARNFHIVQLVPGPGPLETKPAPPGWSSETGRFLQGKANAVGG